ncbi:hypothetical protein VTN77DRAFT_2451 [Rasamsonia byssochlamydoides]|uniref:uncharacterized protein n=1 Tax=Rasamsonia byssochlamydoides TaxID=89139 RepID=UPI003743415D
MYVCTYIHAFEIGVFINACRVTTHLVNEMTLQGSDWGTWKSQCHVPSDAFARRVCVFPFRVHGLRTTPPPLARLPFKVLKIIHKPNTVELGPAAHTGEAYFLGINSCIIALKALLP